MRLTLLGKATVWLVFTIVIALTIIGGVTVAWWAAMDCWGWRCI